MEEWAKNWSFPEETEDQPYLHCGQCSENYRNGGRCMVAGKYQRLPRGARPVHQDWRPGC